MTCILKYHIYKLFWIVISDVKKFTLITKNDLLFISFTVTQFIGIKWLNDDDEYDDDVKNLNFKILNMESYFLHQIKT